MTLELRLVQLGAVVLAALWLTLSALALRQAAITRREARARWGRP